MAKQSAEQAKCARCGHARSEHYIEQDYTCTGLDCTCLGFIYEGAYHPTEPQPPVSEQAKRSKAAKSRHGFEEAEAHSDVRCSLCRRMLAAETNFAVAEKTASILHDKLVAAESALARFTALEAHLPEGYAIGDDATAELAVQLAEARQREEQLTQALRAAVEWEADYRRLNNLVGSPFWVAMATGLAASTQSAHYINANPAPADWPTCTFCGSSISPVTRKCEACGEKLPPSEPAKEAIAVKHRLRGLIALVTIVIPIASGFLGGAALARRYGNYVMLTTGFVLVCWLVYMLQIYPGRYFWEKRDTASKNADEPSHERD